MRRDRFAKTKPLSSSCGLSDLSRRQAAARLLGMCRSHRRRHRHTIQSLIGCCNYMQIYSIFVCISISLLCHCIAALKICLCCVCRKNGHHDSKWQLDFIAHNYSRNATGSHYFYICILFRVWVRQAPPIMPIITMIMMMMMTSGQWRLASVFLWTQRECIWNLRAHKCGRLKRRRE